MGILHAICGRLSKQEQQPNYYRHGKVPQINYYLGPVRLSWQRLFLVSDATGYVIIIVQYMMEVETTQRW